MKMGWIVVVIVHLDDDSVEAADLWHALFNNTRFTGELEAKEIAIGMDGRGRCMDNIFVERLWRSLKQEEVYLKDYASVAEARAGIDGYFRFYNRERLHQSLEYRTPAAVYQGRA